MHVCGLSQFRQQVKLLFSQSKSDLGQTQIGIEKSKQTYQTWARRLKKSGENEVCPTALQGNKQMAWLNP